MFNSLLIDLGSTNICIKAVIKDVAIEKSMRNSLFQFGPDIISRISKQNQNKSLIAKYQNVLLSDLKYLLKEIESDISFEKCYIAGNPAMIYFLCAKDAQVLGAYPFKAEIVNSDVALLLEALNAKVAECETIIIVPFLGSLVGSDIYSCFYYIKEKFNLERFVLVDIGTNAEMLVFDGAKIFVASAAAGPAFGNKGSNLVADVAGALRKGEITKEGLYYIDDDSFQKKIRIFQVAKSAIRTGLELLMNESGINRAPLFIAGLFGEKLENKDILDTGMLPDIFNEIHYVGNASLKGIEKMLFAGKDEFTDEYAISIVELANHNDFNVKYMRNMNF